MTERTDQYEDHDNRSGDLRPIPDPTFLTTQQLNARVAGVREILETRLNGMDRAVELLAAWRETVPGQIRAEVSHLKAVIDEKLTSVTTLTMTKFDGVTDAFVERDKRTEQLSNAQQVAVAAALQAQKESAGAQRDSNTVALVKMENNFIKLIDEGKVLLQQVVKSTDEKINDLKSILDRGEGKTSVSDPAISENMRHLTVMIADLVKSRDSTSGNAQGSASTWALMITLLTVVLVAAGVALRLFAK